MCVRARGGVGTNEQTTQRRNDAAAGKGEEERGSPSISSSSSLSSCVRLAGTLHPAHGPPIIHPKTRLYQGIEGFGEAEAARGPVPALSHPQSISRLVLVLSLRLAATPDTTRDSLATGVSCRPLVRFFLQCACACAACLGCCTTHSPVKSQPHGFATVLRRVSYYVIWRAIVCFVSSLLSTPT